MDKAGREGKPLISGLYEYRHNTAHTQGERPSPPAKHLRNPGNVPDLTRTHEEAREQAGKELH